MKAHQLKSLFPYLELPFVEVLLNECTLMHIPPGQEIISQDGFIPGVPIVVEGLVKVTTRQEDRSLLLYYIKSGQSCVMSFSSCLKGTPSQIYATTVKDTQALLVPLNKLQPWLKEYPSFNSLFYNQFDTRYTDLINNVQQLLFHKLDERLYTYLKDKTKATGEDKLKASHQEIASDLATAREVISRTLKKLENDGKVSQTTEGIVLL